MTEIERFNQEIRENKEMQEEIKNIGSDLDKLVAYANSKGYKFTVADVEARAKQGGELSEDQLDNVAGGVLVAKGVFSAVAIF